MILNPPSLAVSQTRNRDYHSDQQVRSGDIRAEHNTANTPVSASAHTLLPDLTTLTTWRMAQGTQQVKSRGQGTTELQQHR